MCVSGHFLTIPKVARSNLTSKSDLISGMAWVTLPRPPLCSSEINLRKSKESILVKPWWQILSYRKASSRKAMHKEVGYKPTTSKVPRALRAPLTNRNIVKNRNFWKTKFRKMIVLDCEISQIRYIDTIDLETLPPVALLRISISALAAEISERQNFVLRHFLTLTHLTLY